MTAHQILHGFAFVTFWFAFCVFALDAIAALGGMM